MARVRYRIAAAVFWGLFFPTQQQLAKAQAPGQCTLAVNVLNAATHAGLSHAMVSYSGLQSGYSFTDFNGDVRVENVVCGSYILSVSKPGFVSSAQTGWFDVLLHPVGFDEFSAELAAQAEQRVTPVHKAVYLTRASPLTRMALLPVSSIGGVVRNEKGEPLNGISVQAIMAQTSLAGITYSLARTARTDESGRYKLAGLVPGDYVVRLAGKVASHDPAREAAANIAGSHRGIPLVYYSDVTTLAAATVLHVAPGEHASADFQHAMQPAFNVDGHLAGFVPGASIRIDLYPENDRIPTGNVSVDTSTGLFQALDVPAGTYILRALQYQTARSQWLMAEMPVVVQAKPIHNLIVPLSSGVDIPVSVLYEAGAEAGEPVEVVLKLQHAHIRRELVVGDSRPLVDAKPRPLLTNVGPDSYKLYVGVSERSKSYVASATLGNADALHGEFRLSGNSEDRLHVTIRGDGASVAGQVVFQEQPAAGAQIYLVPSGNPEGTKIGIADQRGQFLIQGLPPGNFRIYAWMATPALADLLSGRGELLILQPSENKTVMLEAAQTSSERGEQ